MDDVQQLRLIDNDNDDTTPRSGESSSTVSSPPVSSPTPVSLSDFGEVLTVEEAASLLRIGRANAYEAARRWRATGREGLPVIQMGRRLLVPRAALERLLRQVESTGLGIARSEEAAIPRVTQGPVADGAQ